MDKLAVTLEVPEFVKFLDYLEEAVEKDATEAEYNAGMGGYHHDGGARAMRDSLAIYIMGLNKEIPKHWDKYLEEFKFKRKLEKDPEYQDDYAEFLRLKDKFKEVPHGTV